MDQRILEEAAFTLIHILNALQDKTKPVQLVYNLEQHDDKWQLHVSEYQPMLTKFTVRDIGGLDVIILRLSELLDKATK